MLSSGADLFSQLKELCDALCTGLCIKPVSLEQVAPDTVSTVRFKPEDAKLLMASELFAPDQEEHIAVEAISQVAWGVGLAFQH